MTATHGSDPRAIPDLINDRFDLVSLLKQGNGVSTFAGIDHEDRADVIIKTIDINAVPTAVRLRLEHEARVLEQLGLGEKRRILWSGQEGHLFYLVQPRLDGRTLAELLREGPLSVDQTLQIAANVLAVLEVVHEQGVLHRDIKPNNIMVTTTDRDNTVELIDFGLARSGELDDALSDEPVGTVRYIAPEAAGLIKVGIDQRSDLYSLGVVLYECLAGKPPFEGESVGELLRQHLNVEAPQLRSIGVSVPRAVDGLIQHLMAKDPVQRYQSAHSALADVNEIIAGISAGSAEPPVTPGRHDRRHVLTEPTFVGRSTELHVLTDLLDRPDTARRALVLIEAESGAGKTRLLDELALQASRRDFWVLRGQGIDQAARRPFQVLDGVVAGIVTDATSAPGESLGQRLGSWAEATAAALPRLAPVLGAIDEKGLGPEDFGETRSIDALSKLFDALGQPDRPTLILLDDCQWADQMTLSLLAKWRARKERKTSGVVVVVAAFRSEEVGATHPLRLLDPTVSLTLGPFNRNDVEALCLSMAGSLPFEAVSTVARLADGSPFMASAVLRGMVETGALRDTPEGWEIDPEPMQDVQTSRKAALFLSKRFDLLTPTAVRLLTVGAIIGKEFDLTLAVSLSGQAASDVTHALDDARRRRILWVDESLSRCSFTHDKLREDLLDRLQPSERQALHREAAERIETIDSERVFELAYHFDAAGETLRALPYALQAAELARGRHALDVALTHYRIALRAALEMSDQPDPALSARIAEGLGDVLTLQGDYPNATHHLEDALSHATDAVGRAVIEGKLGNIAFKCGDQAKACQYLEGALRDLGRWVPRSKLTLVLAAVSEIFIQALHTIVPRLFLARRTLEGSEREFVAIRIFSRLAYAYWFSAGKVPCAWAHLREMNLAERYPPTLELAQAYSEHAPVMTMIPLYSRGLSYAKRSLDIRRAAGDVWGQGQSLNFHGVALYASSRYRECIEACRESVLLLERTGDRWEQNTAIWHQIFSHYRLGELKTAYDMARDLYYAASAIGDNTASGIALSGWARAGLGDVPEPFVAIELGRDLGDAQTATEVHLADGLRLLYAGQLKEATERLVRANEIVSDAGLRQEYVAPVKPWLATALRMQVEATDPYDPHTRARLLRRAARAARKADRQSRFYRNNRPHALRERALVAELQGRGAKAQRFFARSMTVSTSQGAAYEAALTRVAAARLAAARGQDEAGTALARAEADRRTLEPRPAEATRSSLSLVDRFEMLLLVGRRIGSAASPSAVYQEVREAATLLLRGDDCTVVLLGESADEPMVTVSGETVEGMSMSLLTQAIEQMVPVVSRPMDEADSTDSMLLAELRSVLCAPIICEGRPVACFSVTHHQVNDLFGDVEVQVAEFIATLAGAALEHVAGSEAHFRSLAQNSSDVTTIVDRSGKITYQSSSVEQVFGMKPEDLVGKDLSAWLHPDDAHLLLAFLDADNYTESASGLVQTRMRHRDGTWRVGESAVRSLFNDPGVEGLVLNTRDASERVALEAELRLQASHDPLTGLANRVLFVERVDSAFTRRRNQEQSLAVIFLDLDDFKSINDSLGHATGDALLKMTGQRLEQCVRPGDTVARWGGDEFALLLENADDQTANAIVKRIIAELGLPYSILGQEVLSRASMGVAVTHHDDTAEDLLVGADVAMYVAKARGKSRYEFFETEMREAAVERSALRTDLDWVIHRGELTIHYQPIVELPKGSLCGFEALVRWNHPTRGQLLPSQWIGIAEDGGLINAIGRWVLRTACQQGAEWRRLLAEDLTISVNISARQLQGPGLVDEVAAALADSQLDPGALVLEITESATMEDTAGVMGRLHALKSLGVGLSLDDFGTGHSSLTYLRRYPVDYLKIDRSFIADVVTNPEDLAIVASVIDLGHSLGLRVVAEGVETAAQVEKLSEMGCDQSQGFIWRHPADRLDVGSWLDTLEIETSPTGLGTRDELRLHLSVS